MASKAVIASKAKAKAKAKTPSVRAKPTDAERAATRALKHAQEQAIQRAITINANAGEQGAVECAKLKMRFAPGDKHWPVREGYRNINVCSSSPSPLYRQLSPMKLGPIRFREFDADGVERDYVATNVENLWQFCKVWPDDVDDDGVIKPEWFAWRDAGWADEKPHRHPRRTGKVNFNAANPSRPLYSLWRGQRLDYLDARVRVYMAVYTQLVRTTAAYQALQRLVDGGTNVQLLGYDGIDVSAENKTLAECLADGCRPFGHELVLMGMLRDERVWERHPAWLLWPY